MNPSETPSGSLFVPKYLQLFFIQMATGKAAVSASGAAMSKYDVEVEARLKKIEAEIKSIKEDLKKHDHGTSASGGGDVEARLDDLISKLGKKMAL